MRPEKINAPARFFFYSAASRRVARRQYHMSGPCKVPRNPKSRRLVMQKLAPREPVELSDSQLRLVAGGGTSGGSCCRSGGNTGNQNSAGLINVLNGNNIAVAVGVGNFAAAGYSS